MKIELCSRVTQTSSEKSLYSFRSFQSHSARREKMIDYKEEKEKQFEFVVDHSLCSIQKIRQWLDKNIEKNCDSDVIIFI